MGTYLARRPGVLALRAFAVLAALTGLAAARPAVAATETAIVVTFYRGSRASCVSTIGAHDMLGNLYEWTEVFPVESDVHGRAGIIGSAFGVGTGNPAFPGVQGPIAVHTDTGFRCAR